MRFLLLLLLGFSLSAAAQSPHFTSIGRIVWHSPAFTQLVPATARIEVVAAGLGHTEGPLWVPDSSMLLFSDTHTRTVYRWTAARGLTKFLEGSGYTGRLPYSAEPGSNGLTLDGRGNLLLCEHGDRRVARLPLATPSGKLTVVDQFEGRRLNSPNDLLVHPATGALYFTDPPYGLPAQDRDPQREQPVAGVYCLDAKGRLTREISDLSRPNGLALTADGATLYVSESDSLKPRIWAYEVKANGQLGKGRVFFDMTSLPQPRHKEQPDGLKVDRAGNVWATGFGGISVISPAGQLLGTIDTGEVIANCAWGDDGKTLYLASGPFVCRLRTNMQGVMPVK